MARKKRKSVLAFLTALCLIVCGTVKMGAGMSVLADDPPTTTTVKIVVKDNTEEDTASPHAIVSYKVGTSEWQEISNDSQEGKWTKEDDGGGIQFVYSISDSLSKDSVVAVRVAFGPNDPFEMDNGRGVKIDCQGKETELAGTITSEDGCSYTIPSDTPETYRFVCGIVKKDGGNGGENEDGPRMAQVVGLHLSSVGADGKTTDANLDMIKPGSTAFPVEETFDFDNFDIEVMGITALPIDGEGNEDWANAKFVGYADKQPNNFRSGLMFDDQGRDAFQVMTHIKQENVFQGGILFHEESSGNTEGFPGFYVTQLTLMKPAYRGVGIATPSMPDMFDFASYNAADLSTTSEEKPGEINCYYDDKTIQLVYEGYVEIEEGKDPKPATITNIEPYKLPAGAVTVNKAEGKVTFNSAFYNEVPLKITLSDGTVGYIVINRIGVEMMMNGLVDGEDREVTRPNHGASGAGAEFPAAYQGKYNLTAAFYHSDEEEDTKYELFAILYFADGTVKTDIVKAYGGNTCNMDKNLRGSDYILWSGSAQKDGPVSAYVTAVPAGALSGSSFGGCTFGSGAGVEWKADSENR